ncbi:MAG TPA: hypothetical protein VNE86_04535 [Nitrososphaerales archaeon]|nr:hypothetical protein [Nitrososphaerales archaeon]
MQNITWIDRIADDSNLWFRATRSEDEEDYLSAIRFYLQDASDCLGQHMLLRAALSSSCAADCLARMGDLSLAHSLYSETASIYQENSEITMSHSIRESLWSLRETYEYLLLAGENQKAQEIYKRFSLLAKRVDPFYQDEKIQLPLANGILGNLKIGRDITHLKSSTEVVQATEKFLQIRKSQSYLTTRSAVTKVKTHEP